MKGLLLQIDIAKIVVHEADEPDAFVNFLDAEPLSCEARTNKGMTQRDLARRINVTQSVISKVEKGYPGASVGLIFQILRTLGLPMSVGDAIPPPGKGHKAVYSGNKFYTVDLDAIANTGLKSSAAMSGATKRK